MAADVNKQADEAQPSAPEQPQYREVSEEELKRILADHQEWLETNGEKGIRADLEGAELSGAKLQGAYLLGADLQGAYLRYAYQERAYVKV